MAAVGWRANFPRGGGGHEILIQSNEIPGLLRD